MTQKNIKTLFNKSIDGHQITVEQSDQIVTLHFNNGLIQSQINIDKPEELPLLGNRMMLSHLIFEPEPEQILLAGCGGGAIARWFNALLPQCKGIAVENNEHVISIAKQYFKFPSEETNWSITQADIRTYIKNTDTDFDFILFDIEVNQQTPDWMIRTEFIQQCKDRLTASGVITFNIVARQNEDFAKALWPIRQIFPDSTYCLANKESQNIMITAFKNKPDLKNIHIKAQQAEETYHLNLEKFLAQIQKDNPPDSGVF